jgi:hypothetical protein
MPLGFLACLEKKDEKLISILYLSQISLGENYSHEFLPHVRHR